MYKAIYEPEKILREISAFSAKITVARFSASDDGVLYAVTDGMHQ